MYKISYTINWMINAKIVNYFIKFIYELVF